MMTRKSANGVRVVGRGCDTSRIRGQLAAYIFLGTTAIVFSSSAAEPETDTAEQKGPRRPAALKAMRELAEAPTVSFQNDSDRPLELMADPLLRYSDPQYNRLDCSLWAWGDGGRPQALITIHMSRWNDDVPPQITWGQAFFSISENNLQASWPNGRHYKTSEPGFKLRTFTDGPKPAATKPARLTQMRELARRFWVGGAKGDYIMRLLPTPLYRYTDAQAGVQDGALFAFVWSATNPGMVLTLELSQPTDATDGNAADADAKWQYSFRRMGAGDVAAKLDGRTVYETAHSGHNPVQEPTWMWFFEKGTEPQEQEKEE